MPRNNVALPVSKTNIVKKHLVLAMLVLNLMLLTSTASAIGLSSFRVYLDFDKREHNFMVYNRDPFTQHCQLFLRHYLENDKGNLILDESDILPQNSVEPWLRFSPRKFSVAPGQAQTVRFKLRRKANVVPAEYHSHMAVDCEFDKDEYDEYTAQSEDVVQLVPRLRHNIPVIVRTGKLDVDISFSDLIVKGNQLSLVLNRRGQRSIFGDLELVDTRSDKVISNKPKVSLYENTKESFNLVTDDTPVKYLKLRFIENTEFGGEKVIEKLIQ
jgi:hypothetical protein